MASWSNLGHFGATRSSVVSVNVMRHYSDILIIRLFLEDMYVYSMYALNENMRSME